MKVIYKQLQIQGYIFTGNFTYSDHPWVKGTKTTAIFGVTTTEPTCRMSQQTTSLTGILNFGIISYYACMMGVFLVKGLTGHCHLFVNSNSRNYTKVNSSRDSCNVCLVSLVLKFVFKTVSCLIKVKYLIVIKEWLFLQYLYHKLCCLLLKVTMVVWPYKQLSSGTCKVDIVNNDDIHNMHC